MIDLTGNDTFWVLFMEDVSINITGPIILLFVFYNEYSLKALKYKLGPSQYLI